MWVRLSRMTAGDHPVRLAMMRGVRRRLRLHVMDRRLVVVRIDLRLGLNKISLQRENATCQKQNQQTN